MNTDLWIAVDRYLTDHVVPPDPALDHALATSTTAGLPRSRSPRTMASFCISWRRYRGRAVSSRSARSAATARSGSRAPCPRRSPHHARVRSETRRGRPCQHRPRRPVAHGGGPRGPGARHAAAARGRRQRPLRPDLHRRRQGQHASVLHLGAHLVPAWKSHHRRQRGAGRCRRRSVDRDPSVQGMRRFFELVRAEPRIEATAIQTVGMKGYDGLAILRVIDAAQ